MATPTDAEVRAAEVARTGYGRPVALIAARTRDLALAEDVLADASDRALRTWPAAGVPDSTDDATAAYQRAISLTTEVSVRRFLEHRMLARAGSWSSPGATPCQPGARSDDSRA